MRVTTWEWLHTVAINYTGDDCLLWPFGRNSAGRGATAKPGVGWYAAHVAVCEATKSPRPSPYHEAAHSCGRGHDGCVAPKHLRWATAKENQADRRKHGTHREGTAIRHKAKLTEAEARYIATSPNAGVDLADRFGVSPSAISHIRRGRNWKSVQPRLDVAMLSSGKRGPSWGKLEKCA